MLQLKPLDVDLDVKGEGVARKDQAKTDQCQLQFPAEQPNQQSDRQDEDRQPVRKLRRYRADLDDSAIAVLLNIATSEYVGATPIFGIVFQSPYPSNEAC